MHDETPRTGDHGENDNSFVLKIVDEKTDRTLHQEVRVGDSIPVPEKGELVEWGRLNEIEQVEGKQKGKVTQRMFQYFDADKATDKKDANISIVTLFVALAR